MTRWCGLLLCLLFTLAGLAAELPSWSFECEAMPRNLGPGQLDITVRDPDASNHMAVRAESGWTGYLCFGGYTVMQPGEYTATFRLKTSDNTTPQSLVQFYVENTDAARVLHGADFTAPNVYQDFTLTFALKKRTLVGLPVSRRPLAGVVVWADCIKVQMTRAYTDDEQLTLIDFKRQPNVELPDNAAGVCLAKGVYHECWHVADVIPYLEQAFTGCAVYTDQRGEYLRDFPTTIEALLRFRAVVLADVPAGALTVEQRALLEEYVQAGGGLLVLGGPFAFGPGDYAQSSILGRLLPVVVSGRFDVARCLPATALQPAGASPLTDELPWTDAPQLYYLHNAVPKPDAVVLVKAGVQPVVVTGINGRGRVAVMLMTPLGDSPAGQTAWWNWSGWPPFLLRMLGWVEHK